MPQQSRSYGVLIGIGALWALVLVLWSGDTFRSGFSVLFLLAASAVAVYAVGEAVKAATAGEPYRSSRRGLLMGAAVLIPVLFDPRTYDVFNVSKYMALTVVACLIVGIWAIEAILLKRTPRWRNGLHWPVLFLLGWQVLSTAVNGWERFSVLGFYASQDGLYAAIAFVVIFFAVADVFELRHLRPALSILYFGGGGLAVLYGAIQLHDRTYGGQWDWVIWGDASFKGSSIWSTLGNPNHLAGFLAIVLPIGVCLFLLYRSWPVRVLIAAIAAVLVLELLQTTTRGALLASMVALAVIGVLLLPEIKGRPLVALGVAAGLGLAVVGAGLILDDSRSLSGRITTALDFDGASTATQRIELWKAAGSMGVDRPLFGYGPDSFRTRFPAYQSKKFVDLYGANELANGPHNTFMNYLATSGVPGLLAFLAVLGMLGALTQRTWRRLRRNELDGGDAARQGRLLVTAAVGGLVGYLVQASFNVQQIGLTFCFWLLVGLLVASARSAGVPRGLRAGPIESWTEPEPPPPAALPPRRADNTRRRSARRKAPTVDPVRAVAAGLVGVVALGLAWQATAPYRADISYRNALINQNAAGTPGLPEQELQRLRNVSTLQLQQASKLNPWEPTYIELFGRGNAQARQATNLTPDQQLQQLRVARVFYERVLKLDPRNVAYLERYYRVLIDIQDLDQQDRTVRPAAVDALERAMAANPWEIRSAASLSSLLQNSGDIPEAIKVLRPAIDRVPDNVELVRQMALLVQTVDAVDATVWWKRLLRLAPTDPQALQYVPPPTTATVGSEG